MNDVNIKEQGSHIYPLSTLSLHFRSLQVADILIKSLWDGFLYLISNKLMKVLIARTYEPLLYLLTLTAQMSHRRESLMQLSDM